ncbi:MAG: DNA-processing protein DprA [Patescibacteria group bacterium]
MMNTNVIAKEDELYPRLLKEIKDAPKKLYYKGRWDVCLFEACLAVVGTRRMTTYGKRVCEELVGEIASAGITIVSGFMYGIDATGHQAALRAGGKTIAVMPCGIERIHPEYQKELYEEILECGGLAISEYEGNLLPALWTYPKRNRIVAGLSQATVVIEAGEKSGSLITANFARMYGRKLFAVPGPITSVVSQGTLGLLGEGATVVKSADTILEYYRSIGVSFSGNAHKEFSPHADSGQAQDASTLEQRILEHLRRESMELDVLSRTIGVPAAQLGATLSLMQLNGFITEESGKYYVR